MRSSIFMVDERLLVASASGLGGNLELLRWCPANTRGRSVEQRPWPRAGPCRWNRGPCDRHFAWPRIDEKCSRAETPWVERKQVCPGSWWPFAWRHKRPHIMNSKFKSRPDKNREKSRQIINLRNLDVKMLGHFWKQMEADSALDIWICQLCAAQNSYLFWILISIYRVELKIDLFKLSCSDDLSVINT